MNLARSCLNIWGQESISVKNTHWNYISLNKCRTILKLDTNKQNKTSPGYFFLPIPTCIHSRYSGKGAVTCAVCPESAWLVTFLIGNVSTGVVTWSALRCGASGESGKKVATAPLSKTAAAAAAAKTWFAKHPLDYMLHNRFPWKRSGRRSSMWPPYSLRRNLSAAACVTSHADSIRLQNTEGGRTL